MPVLAGRLVMYQLEAECISIDVFFDEIYDNSVLTGRNQARRPSNNFPEWACRH